MNSFRFQTSCRTLFVFACASWTAACGGSQPAPSEPPAPSSLPAPPPPPVAAAEAAPAPPAEKQPEPPPPPALPSFKDIGLSTPESVYYDAKRDQYLVSNINGTPLTVDGNGFVSKLSPEGKVIDLKWINGEKKGTKLNAPKGLTISGDTLYVADIDQVRTFDAETGAPKTSIKISGATFLNDVATASDGSVYVSDSGLKAGKSGFEPSGSDAVYKIDKAGKVKAVAKSKDLGGPNGLLPDDSGVWVVTFGSGELYHLDEKGKKASAQKLPKGTLDGIVSVDGEVLISSWEGSTVYRGKPGGDFKPVVDKADSPADIGYDSKRNRLLIPLFMGNAVRVEEVK